MKRAWARDMGLTCGRKWLPWVYEFYSNHHVCTCVSKQDRHLFTAKKASSVIFHSHVTTEVRANAQQHMFTTQVCLSIATNCKNGGESECPKGR